MIDAFGRGQCEAQWALHTADSPEQPEDLGGGEVSGGVENNERDAEVTPLVNSPEEPSSAGADGATDVDQGLSKEETLALFQDAPAAPVDEGCQQTSKVNALPALLWLMFFLSLWARHARYEFLKYERNS